MKELIVVTKNKVIIAIPVKDLINLQKDDEIAGVVIVDSPDKMEA